MDLHMYSQDAVGSGVFQDQGMAWPVGGAKCRKQDSHQALQGSVHDIELPGSRVTHFLLKLQVNDGEVDAERHQDRACSCRGD